MEGLSTNFYKGLRGYWKRKNYQRIDGSSHRRSRRNRVKLGSGEGSNRRKRFWKIKITPKLRFISISSTKRFFIRLRDAYVNMMLGVASSRSLNSGIAGGIGGSIGYKFGKDPIKEYDEKVIMEIYKARLAQGRLANGTNPNAVPVKLATVLESR
ncbi:hypothetical protein ACHQM5_015292 [Ranunculus cassubicifolius]